MAADLKITLCKMEYVFVVCGCETWSLTFREECRLRVFENRVLMKIFGPKREMEKTT